MVAHLGGANARAAEAFGEPFRAVTSTRCARASSPTVRGDEFERSSTARRWPQRPPNLPTALGRAAANEGLDGKSLGDVSARCSTCCSTRHRLHLRDDRVGRARAAAARSAPPPPAAELRTPTTGAATDHAREERTASAGGGSKAWSRRNNGPRLLHSSARKNTFPLHACSPRCFAGAGRGPAARRTASEGSARGHRPIYGSSKGESGCCRTTCGQRVLQHRGPRNVLTSRPRGRLDNASMSSVRRGRAGRWYLSSPCPRSANSQSPQRAAGRGQRRTCATRSAKYCARV